MGCTFFSLYAGKYIVPYPVSFNFRQKDNIYERLLKYLMLPGIVETAACLTLAAERKIVPLHCKCSGARIPNMCPVVEVKPPHCKCCGTEKKDKKRNIDRSSTATAERRI